jgi:hypothetical protein
VRVAPYVCAASWASAAKIFVVGKRQADEYEYANHALRHTEHIDGCRASRRLNRIGPFGITPLDELEPALTTERDSSTRPETVRVCSSVSNRIRNQATASCCVILVGCEPELKRVLAGLPAHVACRVCIDEQQATRQRHSERSLAELCERHLQRYDGERQHALLDEFFSPQQGALGVPAVTRSLSQDRVRCLLFTPRFTREAEDVLEYVMQCALDQGAQIEMLNGTDADRLDAAGGVGATLLRRENVALPT